jgi:translocation and assembly module TamA
MIKNLTLLIGLLFTWVWSIEPNVKNQHPISDGNNVKPTIHHFKPKKYDLTKYPNRTWYDLEMHYYDVPDFLKKKLENNSILKKRSAMPPQTAHGLKRRCLRDIQNFQTLFHSYGYYDLDIHYSIEKKESVEVITMRINPGVRYTISNYIYDGFQVSPEKGMLITTLKQGIAIHFDRIKKGRERLIKYLKMKGYAFADVDEPVLDLNQTDKTASLTFPVQLNLKRVFGPGKIHGLKNLDSQYVKNRLAFKEGQTFDQRLLEKTQYNLINTGLFSSVRLTPEKTPFKETPIDVSVSQAPPRSLSVGIQYLGSEGFGGDFHLAHNNISDHGDTLSLDAVSLKKLKQVKLGYHQNDFIIPLLSFNHDLAMKHERTAAYIIRETTFLNNLIYPFSDHWIGRFGLQPETFRSSHQNTVYKGKVLSVPMGVQWNQSNSLLNPTKGFKLDLFLDNDWGPSGIVETDQSTTNQESGQFRLSKIKLYGTVYIPASTRTTFAVWGRMGRFLASPKDFNNIPPQKRLYSGGATSVLSYRYLTISPYDQYGLPTGGRSLLEGGAEVRYKLDSSMMGTVFLEGGSVSQKKYPSLKRPLYGSGVGFLYFMSENTPFRANIAFPFKKRKVLGRTIDAPFQLYISVGQSF